MDELSALLIAKALDGLALRASAIAQNIANAGSPSYVPLRVSFEGELQDAARVGPEAVSQISPHYMRAMREVDDDKVRPDLEMAAASQTALRYAALADIFGRQMQIAHLAVSGGRP